MNKPCKSNTAVTAVLVLTLALLALACFIAAYRYGIDSNNRLWHSRFNEQYGRLAERQRWAMQCVAQYALFTEPHKETVIALCAKQAHERFPLYRFDQ